MVASSDVVLELYGGALCFEVATREDCDVIRKNVGLEVADRVSIRSSFNTLHERLAKG